MRRAAFVDTSAWYALTDAGDTNHARATHRFRSLLGNQRTLVTTNHIMSETYTLLHARLGHSAAQEFLRRLRASSFTQRTFVPESWEEAAEALLAQYADQDFSYVDATSFVTMHRLGLQDALAFDHHFAVAGFTLLSEAP